MSLYKLVALLLVSALLGGCAAAVAPLTGFIYTGVKAPVDGEPSADASKEVFLISSM